MKNLCLTFLALFLSFSAFAVPPITGDTTICTGASTTLADGASGGVWSSSNTSVATINAATGVVSAVSAGTAIISYDVAGVYATALLTVDPSPSAITGITSICGGGTTTLADAVFGGVWTSSDVAIATCGATSGIVTGIITGTTIITYTISTGCATTVVVTIAPAPAPITGPSTVCVGSDIILTDATAGGVWSSTLATVGSTGMVTGISAGVATVTYTIGSTGCTAYHTVTVNPSPTVYTVTGGGAYCSGGPGVNVGLSNSQVGVSYQLYLGGVATGSPVAGTGSALSFGSQTAAGTYTIETTSSACGSSISMSGSAAISISPLPITYSVTGGGSFCAGSAGVHVGLGTSSTGVTYDLYDGGTLVSSLTGTGAPIDFGYLTTSGVYYVYATSVITGCTAMMTDSAGITVNPLPNIYAVIGSSYCAGSSGGDVTLSGSDLGINYQLYDGGTATGLPISGTGSALDFGAHTAGSYTIVATNPTTGCSATMSGGGVVTVEPVPTVYTVGGGGSYCAGGTGVDITLASSVTGVSYQLYLGGVAIGSLVAGTGSSLDFGLATTAGTYTIVATSTTTGCTSTMAGSAVVTITATVTPTVSISASPGDTVCTGTSVTFTPVPVNGGSSPAYQWYINGTGAGTSATYSFIPTEGDIVEVRMASSASCAMPDTVESPIVTMEVIAIPTVTATSAPAGCGAGVTLTASGATSYSWSPSTGLSCPLCAVTNVVPTGSTTYVVTGTTSGCSGTASITVSNNSIFGSVSFGGTTPDTLDMKVWLIQFNSLDSTLIAQDSMLTCLSGGMPYYEFDGVASGNYLVKGKLLYGNPAGASGYLPTYGASSAFWYTASNISHSSFADSMGIDMIYGTVPPGPGFIGGLISSGAGRGTSTTVPAVGMLVYLKDAATNDILTFTYTDGSGAYSFSNLANGSYIIYPENFDNYTTPSSIITLTPTNESVSGINFIQHTTSKTIVPLITNAVKTVTSNANINVYPNPTTGNLNIQWTNQLLGSANIVVTDVLGREAVHSVININAVSGQAQLDLSALKDGIYFLTIKSDNIYYNAKLQVQQ